MSTVLGILDLNDTSDDVFMETVGQNVVYDATLQVLGDHNADLAAMMSVFVERTTDEFKIRYRLAGNGYLQERTSGGGQTNRRSRKVTGSWDVAFPLRDWGDALSADDVTLAYMSVQEMSLHVDGVTKADINTTRDEVLFRLFNNTQTEFLDPRRGTLLVEPLANNDDTLYPPIIGTVDEAKRDRYAESGYAAADIDDTNNPYATITAALELDFGKRTGGESIVTFINGAQVGVTKDLTNFIEVPDNFIVSGDNISVPTNLPANLPGRVIGRTDGTWVVEWDWVPANYMLAQHLEAPKPLYQRVDMAGTGLPIGLSLVSRDEKYPLLVSEWRHRFGIGCANRLNGFVMELGTGGTYTIPAAYQ